MVLSTQITFQKIWLPQGEYPRIVKYVYYYEVLKKLRKIYFNQKIFLIWNKTSWHKDSKEQKFIKQDGNIEIIEFPRAAPEENSQKHILLNFSGTKFCLLLHLNIFSASCFNLISEYFGRIFFSKYVKRNGKLDNDCFLADFQLR